MIPESLWTNSVLAIGSFIFALVLILFFINIEAKNKELRMNFKKIFASVSKYSIVFGIIFIIVGAAFLVSIIFSSESMFLVEQERLKHETKPPPELIPYGYYWFSKVPPYILELNSAYFNIRFFGFLLLGCLLFFIGILIVFPTILTKPKKYLEIKNFKWNTKKSLASASIAMFFLFLCGYLMYINYLDYEWMVNGWNFGGFDFFKSSTDSIFFTSLLIAVIVFIPLFIFKIGFLDNVLNKSKIINVNNDSNLKEKQNSLGRLIEFLEKGYIAIKNYMFPAGFILVILGGCFMALPSRFLIDSYPDFMTETGEVFIERYYGLIRGQLLLIGIPLSVLGFSLIIRYILDVKNKEPKLRPNKILAFINKFSKVFVVLFIIIGVLFLVTTLVPWGINIFWFDWYIKNYFWFWYIRIPLLFIGFVFFVSGLILIIRFVLHKQE